MSDRRTGSWAPVWAGLLVGVGLPLGAQGVITTFMALQGLGTPESGATQRGFAVALGAAAFIAGVLLMTAGAARMRGVLRNNAEHRAANGGDGRVVPYVWVRFATGVVLLSVVYLVVVALNGWGTRV